MKSFRLFLTCVLIGGLSAMSTPGFADDTELYRGQIVTIGENDRPNILFVLDRTGSMDFLDYDENGDSDGLTRQDRLEAAMLQLLDEVHNVNAGLMTFARSNGSNAAIGFPVTYVDAPARSVTGEFDDTPVVIASIESSSDDAEESITSGAINLTDEILEGTYQEGTDLRPGVSVETRISDDNGDVRQFLGNGSDDEGDVDADGWIAIGGSSRGQVIIGLRFRNVNIPQDAEITSARIVFTAASSRSTPLSDIVIYGVDRSDPSAFNEDDYRITSGSRYPKTSASTAWNDVEPWTQNSRHETPNISGAVQEIVNRSGWSAGNAMAFRIERDANFSDYPDSEYRRFYSYGENSGKAPLLVITYLASEADGGVIGAVATGDNDTTLVEQRISGSTNSAIELRGGGVGSGSQYSFPAGATFLNSSESRLGDGYCANSSNCRGEQLVGLRFANLDIPQGALITSADIQLTAVNTSSINRSDPLNLNIFAEDNVNPVEFSGRSWGSSGRSAERSNPSFDLSSRIRTSTSVPWNNVPSVSDGNTFITPNMNTLLQTLVDNNGWDQDSNAAVFLFERTTPGDGQRDGSRRFFGFSTPSTPAAKLTVRWVIPVESSEQILGLRFQGVQIPQGVTINEAALEFTSGPSAEGGGSLVIHGEDVDESQTFSADDNNISARTKTSASVTWNSIPSWEEDEKHETPNLKDIIQEITDRSDWCGGEAMSFILSGSDNVLRNIRSFDGSPTNAPVLRIVYDANNVPANACINQVYTTQISDGNDDVEETVINDGQSSGSLFKTSSTLELTTTGGSSDSTERIVGLRFPNVPIRQGSTVLSAELVFTARASRSDTTNLSLLIQGERSADTVPFGTISSSFELRDDRPKTAANVQWNPFEGSQLEAWTDGVRYTSPDLTNIVQEIIDLGSWQTFNSMAFFISGTGLRQASSFEHSPNEAPVLRIQIQGGLGDDGQGVFFKPVRQRLKELVREIVVGGTTQIVDALYEAGQYFQGGEVNFGLSRHDQRSNRVSHPGSYEANGSTLIKNDTCTFINPNSFTHCRSERISGGPPIYIPPANSECQANFVVMLSDGVANRNEAQDLIETLLEINSCRSESPTGRNLGDVEKCGIDLAAYLHATDLDDELDGNQNITLYTIGFSLPDPAYDSDGDVDDGRSSENRRAKSFLEELAQAGGGSFFEATSANELSTVFRTILEEILTESTSFAAPTLSVNAFNQLFHNDEIYFALFQPDNQVYWNGNVKKFRLDTAAGASLGQILDRQQAPAINAEGQIRDDAFGLWNATNEPDGSRVTTSGAGAQVPMPDSRVILTNTQADANIDLNTSDNRVATDNTALTESLLGVTSAEERTRLINWILGYRDGLNPPPPAIPELRDWRFGDPLHGSPAAVTYGGTNDVPISKIFTTGNDGGIRMLNGETGQEEWFFIPQDMLAIQQDLMNNASGERIYGIDGSPSIIIEDEDGVIDPSAGDSVKLYVGMRRGGRNVYALDVTPSSTITSNLQTFTPRLMWTVKGGSGDFAQLGQTWSKPIVTEIEGMTGKVVIFGGGYDPDTQDIAADSVGFGPATKGNAIYIVDAETGQRLWWAGNSGSGANLQLSNMIYSIPSDLGLLDSNGDG